MSQSVTTYRDVTFGASTVVDDPEARTWIALGLRAEALSREIDRATRALPLGNTLQFATHAGRKVYAGADACFRIARERWLDLPPGAWVEVEGRWWRWDGEVNDFVVQTTEHRNGGETS